MSKVKISGILTLAFLSTTSWAGIITFHPESAIIAGNGCPNGATRLFVDEFGDLALEHDALSINLPAGGPDTVLAARKSCAIRVPVTIPAGFYVKSIEQRLAYSATKSANAEVRVATRTSLSGDQVNPFTVLLARGDEFYGENMIDSRRDHVGTQHRRAQYCQPDRSEETMLQINIAISGQRDSAYDDLMVGVAGSYIGEGFEIEVESCF